MWENINNFLQCLLFYAPLHVFKGTIVLTFLYRVYHPIIPCFEVISDYFVEK